MNSPEGYKHPTMEQAVDFIRKHLLAVNTLTETQLAEAFRQALKAGDFVRYVVAAPDNPQQVLYMPYREYERVNRLYQELLYAVARKFPDETRHETALRYIRERETHDTGTASENKLNSPTYEP